MFEVGNEKGLKLGMSGLDVVVKEVRVDNCGRQDQVRQASERERARERDGRSGGIASRQAVKEQKRGKILVSRSAEIVLQK